MNEFVIFIEGGGNSRKEQAPLRLAFQSLFGLTLTAAREKKIRHRVIVCGGRSETIRLFLVEKRINPHLKCFLLVDAEEVPAPLDDAIEHLALRDTADVRKAHKGEVGLMVVVMETWLCSDINNLSAYFGSGFRADCLPNPQTGLESVPKDEICEKLKRATKDSKKGVYHKQRHGPDLVSSTDATVLRERCQSFGKFVDSLSVHIDA